jgi:hypothetical protein
MNESQKRTQLIADAIHGEWSTGTAGDFARRAAAQARRRRKLRRTLAGSAGTVALIALILTIARHRSMPSPNAPVAAARPAYEIISDDELISSLRDRPLLVLPKENGSREVRILDAEAGD